jgi:hypothetical protein
VIVQLAIKEEAVIQQIAPHMRLEALRMNPLINDLVVPEWWSSPS